MVYSRRGATTTAWLVAVFLDRQERLNVTTGQRRRLVAGPDESGYTGSVPHNKPRVVVKHAFV